MTNRRQFLAMLAALPVVGTGANTVVEYRQKHAMQLPLHFTNGVDFRRYVVYGVGAPNWQTPFVGRKS